MTGGNILILFSLGSIVLLLFLILYVRLHAFLAQVLTSMAPGLALNRNSGRYPYIRCSTANLARQFPAYPKFRLDFITCLPTFPLFPDRNSYKDSLESIPLRLSFCVSCSEGAIHEIDWTT